jgi:hypothetical protein
LSLFLDKAKWMKDCVDDGDIRPYVYVRKENEIPNPGTRHHLDWFTASPLIKDPLRLDELEFAEQIYHMENAAFGSSAMPMPRWVFYDCAVLPGFVSGFAMKTKKLPDSFRKALRVRDDSEWTPLSLFIIIPTMKKGEWVAHNLCAVNSLIPEADRMYGLGFLSKAFGLWYANVETCCGMTQWGNAALKLHIHYGDMQILTSYTPIHSHAKTLTYRTEIKTESWEAFFNKEEDLAFLEKYEPSGLLIDPQSEQSMIELQKRVENGEGPYFLCASDIALKKLSDPLLIYHSKRKRF